MHIHSRSLRRLHYHSLAFAGTKSYWGSNAETAITVDDAAPQATTAPVGETSQVETYFMPAVIAIIVAIALVGIVMVLMLRKRA